jgi:hypothetical protein
VKLGYGYQADGAWKFGIDAFDFFLYVAHGSGGFLHHKIHGFSQMIIDSIRKEINVSVRICVICGELNF